MFILSITIIRVVIGFLYPVISTVTLNINNKFDIYNLCTVLYVVWMI